MYSWTGKRLKVNLTEGKVVKEDIPVEELHSYLGGIGLNAHVLFNEVKPGIDALGPENVFIIGTSPYNGTCLPCSGRWSITTKSPLTGGYGDGSIGGDFAPELKFAGYDQIVIYGKSHKPVYLFINNDKIEIRDASHLWGKDTWETHYAFIDEIGDPEIKSAVIGPAGENLVRIAIVVSGLCRTGGRGGLGAVLGSKNLKAVVVRGNGSVKVAKKDAFDRIRRAMYQKIMNSDHIQFFKDTGTLWLTAATSPGFLCTRNAQQGFFDDWKKFTSGIFREKWATKKEACFACNISCGTHYEVKEGAYACRGKSPEFGVIAKYMAMIGNDNLEAALYALSLCNKLGIDGVSSGGIIAFAMEAWQKGLISAEETDHLDLNWGNADAAIELTRRMAYREGIGNILAEGSRNASKKIEGSHDLLLEAKGLEWISAYPGVGTDKGRMLATATCTRGCDHLKGYMGELSGQPIVEKTMGTERAKALGDVTSYEGRGAMLSLENRFRAATDSTGFCWFPTEMTARGDLDPDDLAEALSAITGFDLDGEGFLRIGERVHNLQKAFNVREGLKREDDTLPRRFFVEQADEKEVPGVDPSRFQKMLDEYYQFSGWDNEGIPTRAKLEELDLAYVAEQIRAK
jgi:aldehyde:ferredoxin oxidoreductase